MSNFLTDLLLLVAGMLIFEKAIAFQVSLIMSASGQAKRSREELLNMFPGIFDVSVRMIFFLAYIILDLLFLHVHLLPFYPMVVLFALSAFSTIGWDVWYFIKNLKN
jgi:hypothetical protein